MKHETRFQTRKKTMNWSPLNLTVRVGCHLTYETTVQTPVLFVLKPRLEGRVLVMQEKLSFGIGLPLREVMDTLPIFGADSRTLDPTGQTVSQPVTETREMKTENTIANKGESNGLTPAVATCHSKQRRDVDGVGIPLSATFILKKIYRKRRVM